MYEDIYFLDIHIYVNYRNKKSNKTKIEECHKKYGRLKQKQNISSQMLFFLRLSKKIIIRCIDFLYYFHF